MLKINLNRGDTITIKLANGEELLATYEGTEGMDQVVVSKAVVMAPQGEQMTLVPWILTADDKKLNIRREQILVMLHTQQDIARMYTEATTGIQLPK